MDLNIAVLADTAIIDQQERLSIIGIFRHLGAVQVPVRHPRMALVLVFDTNRSDLGRTRELVIEVTDADGKAIMPRIDGELAVPANAAEPPSLQMVINFDDTIFPAFGSYLVSIFVGGELKRALPLEIVAANSAPAR